MTGVVCRETKRKSKGRVRDMIGDIVLVEKALNIPLGHSPF